MNRRRRHLAKHRRAVAYWQRMANTNHYQTRRRAVTKLRELGAVINLF
jgi:hypothetical protein